MLEKSGSKKAKRHLAGISHQLGRVAQDRGDLDNAEKWYKEALKIDEELGNRPGMALTYAQLGLLAEEKGEREEALDWTVRCVSLFDEFPHQATGTGPVQMARLVKELGIETLETSWQRCTNKKLPERVREGVLTMIKTGEEEQK